MANSASGESVTERLVRVLATFSSDRTAQTPSEIARRAHLPMSTAHRIVEDLTTAGLLDRDPRGEVRLGLRLWELAHRGSEVLRLREAARGPMEQVQASIREHTQLAVLENGEALIVERLSDPQAGLNIARVASRLPLHATSSGLVLLAHAPDDVREQVVQGPLRRHTAHTLVDPQAVRHALAEVRATGWAICPGMVSEASTGVAVPVRAGAGRGAPVVAALSVVLPREAEAPRAVAAVLARAARLISSALPDGRAA
ncbi:IclR family transcriptional regulator [Demequina sp. NBRC 110056]|uniref:IclR family transcriptional regulator n=1 Tax=Demequina sp. NBRC 110056 TaxID=1570345 RepID=UPI0009FC56B9|nr:IclR family transcriptional regulator [Demequina sp. NBRC 110056]